MEPAQHVQVIVWPARQVVHANRVQQGILFLMVFVSLYAQVTALRALLLTVCCAKQVSF